MTFLRDIALTEGRCCQCLRMIYTDDDAFVCIDCGGHNQLYGVRQPALWRRIVRRIADFALSDGEKV